MNKRTRIILIAVLALIIAVIMVRIAGKIIQSQKKPRNTTNIVGAMELKKNMVERIINFTGTIEGDPQVLVYPQVGGKYLYSSVHEGDWVSQDQDIVYINRDIVGMNYQPASVRAPISGMVVKLFYADRGATVTIDKPVAQISDPRNIKVIISVGQDDLQRIKSGMPAIIRPVSDPSNVIRGKVYSTTPFVDEDSLSGTVIVKTPNTGDRMKVGATVDIDIVTSAEPMFMVPQEAVLAKMDQTYAFLIKNGRAVQIPVQTGYMEKENIEIKGDFQDGDVMVVQGAFKLSDGALVSTNQGSKGGGKKQAGNRKDQKKPTDKAKDPERRDP